MSADAMDGARSNDRLPRFKLLLKNVYRYRSRKDVKPDDVAICECRVPAYVLPFLDEDEVTESDDDRDDVSNVGDKTRDYTSNVTQCDAAVTRGKAHKDSSLVEAGPQKREAGEEGRQAGREMTDWQADAELGTHLRDSHAGESRELDGVGQDGGVRASASNLSIKEREAGQQGAAGSAGPHNGGMRLSESERARLAGDREGEAGREAKIDEQDGPGKDDGEQGVRVAEEKLDSKDASARASNRDGSETGTNEAKAGEAVSGCQREGKEKVGGKASRGREISFQGCTLDSCLNAMLLTECTPGYCPSGRFCQNQRIQRRQYKKTVARPVGDRGWGLMAAEDIKAGEFVMEYLGEVVPAKVAHKRLELYEKAGERNFYMLQLSSQEVIDPTKRGGMARFINHSCDPNCETRKWTVLSEVCVGVFARKDIPAGHELTYDYDFEWFGGDKVPCLCGAACCHGFLGAKSRAFQLSEHGDSVARDEDGYEVEEHPLYDSSSDEDSLLNTAGHASVLAAPAAATHVGVAVSRKMNQHNFSISSKAAHLGANGRQKKFPGSSGKTTGASSKRWQAERAVKAAAALTRERAQRKAQAEARKREDGGNDRMPGVKLGVGEERAGNLKENGVRRKKEGTERVVKRMKLTMRDSEFLSKALTVEQVEGTLVKVAARSGVLKAMDCARQCDDAFFALREKVADLDDNLFGAEDHSDGIDVQLTATSIERQGASFELFSTFMAEALTIMPLS